MRVSISICPTEMESGNQGDMYDESALLDAIRGFVAGRLGESAEITCLQVGHRQGDGWAKLDGDEEAGEALMEAFWHEHGSDEELYEAAD